MKKIARDRTPHTSFSASTKRRSRYIQVLVTCVVLIILAIVFLLPYVWNVLNALKTSSEFASYPIQWLPSQPQWINFSRALTYVDFGRYLFNSVILAVIYTSLITLSSALVGFGFARLSGWGKQPLFLIMLSTIMLPPVLTVIPTYVLFAKVNLIDTYWPWVFWGLASAPFLSFLFRQFFASIPQELEDAAIIDGCGYFRVFWQIFLPLSRPVIATAAVISFTWVWGDYFTQALFLSQDNTTLAVAMASGYKAISGASLQNLQAAGITLYVLPILLLFFFAQRAFVSGIVTTGLKG